jgi:hypothetical protein
LPAHHRTLGVGEGIVRAAVAGSWLVYAVELLASGAEAVSLLEFAAAALGTVAGLLAVAAWNRARIVALLAALVFLSGHFANVARWVIDGAGIAEILGHSVLRRAWSYYEWSYFISVDRFRSGAFAGALSYFFVDAVMPLLQIGLVIVLLAAARRPAGA